MVRMKSALCSDRDGGLFPIRGAGRAVVRLPADWAYTCL